MKKNKFGLSLSLDPLCLPLWGGGVLVPLAPKNLGRIAPLPEDRHC